MTAHPDPTPLRDLDRLAAAWLDITDQIDALTAQRDVVKAQLRDLGLGEHVAANGTVVTVTAPSRRFNARTAQALLPAEVLELCRADGYDAKKLKEYLSPVLLERCMDAGTGDPIVRVK